MVDSTHIIHALTRFVRKHAHTCAVARAAPPFLAHKMRNCVRVLIMQTCHMQATHTLPDTNRIQAQHNHNIQAHCNNPLTTH